VFHKIRLDYERLHPDNDRQRQRLDKIGVVSHNTDADLYPPQDGSELLSSLSGPPGSVSFTYFPDQDNQEDVETSDMALSLLEDRVRGWLTGESRINPDYTKSLTPRVAKLHRVQTEVWGVHHSFLRVTR